MQGRFVKRPYSKAGMLEQWNIGMLVMVFFFLPIIPPFHHSNIPMLFRFHYPFFSLLCVLRGLCG